MGRLMGFAGLATMLGLAFLFSTNRRKISIKTVIWGISLQFLFALFVLRFSFGRSLLTWAGAGVNQLLSYSFAGSSFVFGELGKKNGQMGFFFAFQVLPGAAARPNAPCYQRVGDGLEVLGERPPAERVTGHDRGAGPACRPSRRTRQCRP